MKLTSSHKYVTNTPRLEPEGKVLIVFYFDFLVAAIFFVVARALAVMAGNAWREGLFLPSSEGVTMLGVFIASTISFIRSYASLLEFLGVAIDIPFLFLVVWGSIETSWHIVKRRKGMLVDMPPSSN